MKLFQFMGEYGLLLYNALRSLTEFNTYRKNLLSELIKIGYDSIPIIILVGAFTGAVMTIQTAYQIDSVFIPPETVGQIVSRSLLIELAIGIGSLVLAGRIGARIATELGSMRVSEQIDALESMGFNSVGYLVLPRIMAGILTFPLLYMFAASFGIGGGLLAGIVTGGVSAADYMNGAKEYFYAWDVVFGIIKAFVFGFVITSIACYKGYNATGGAEGVGKATTAATVLGCVYVLVSDLILTAILL